MLENFYITTTVGTLVVPVYSGRCVTAGAADRRESEDTGRRVV